jgi:DUF4097 and DUF4098 domain-containing protein YvlB
MGYGFRNITFSSGSVFIGGNGYGSESDNDAGPNKIGNFSKTNSNISHAGGQVGGNFSTTNGNIRLSRATLASNLDLRSTNGNLSLRSLNANTHSITARATNGSITVKDTSAKSVSTTNGSIEIENSTIANDVKTTNGSISLSDTTVPNVNVKASNFSVDNSSITGTLNAKIPSGTESSLTIGENVTLSNIKIEPEANFSSIVSNGNVFVGSFSGSMNFTSGGIFVNGRPIQELANNSSMSSRETSLTLNVGRGGKIGALDIPSDMRCKIILSGDAEFSPDSGQNNITVVQR